MGLFDWWRRWRGNRERQIFTFFDGVRDRKIDPFAVYRSTFSVDGFSWDITLPIIRSEAIPGDEGHLKRKLDAIESAAKCAKQVFALPPFSEGGLTEEECVSLLCQFEMYVLGVKKNGSQNPTSSPSAGKIQDVTKDGSDSGSTETESERLTPSGPPRESPGESVAE